MDPMCIGGVGQEYDGAGRGANLRRRGEAVPSEWSAGLKSQSIGHNAPPSPRPEREAAMGGACPGIGLLLPNAQGPRANRCGPRPALPFRRQVCLTDRGGRQERPCCGLPLWLAAARGRRGPAGHVIGWGTDAVGSSLGGAREVPPWFEPTEIRVNLCQEGLKIEAKCPVSRLEPGLSRRAQGDLASSPAACFDFPDPRRDWRRLPQPSLSDSGKLISIFGQAMPSRASPPPRRRFPQDQHSLS